MIQHLRHLFTNNSHLPRKLLLIHIENKDCDLISALATRIKKELKDAHINVQETDRFIDSPFVPLTIIIKTKTLQDGILELQHNRPRVKEEVHVSHLVKICCQYLT